MIWSLMSPPQFLEWTPGIPASFIPGVGRAAWAVSPGAVTLGSAIAFGWCIHSPHLCPWSLSQGP